MDDALGWVVALSLSFVAFRYFFGGSDAAPGPRRRRVVSPAQIEQVTAMFPNIPLPAVRFELERTGSVETTVERILRDGRLPEPPAGFFVDPSAPPPPAPVAPTPAAAAASAPSTPASLITRLGLQSRAASSALEAPTVAVSSEGKGKGKAGWETSPELRERNLKERKERMVLEARRKLLERERERKEAAAASVTPGPSGA